MDRPHAKRSFRDGDQSTVVDLHRFGRLSSLSAATEQRDRDAPQHDQDGDRKDVSSVLLPHRLRGLSGRFR